MRYLSRDPIIFTIKLCCNILAKIFLRTRIRAQVVTVGIIWVVCKEFSYRNIVEIFAIEEFCDTDVVVDEVLSGLVIKEIGNRDFIVFQVGWKYVIKELNDSDIVVTQEFSDCRLQIEHSEYDII